MTENELKLVLNKDGSIRCFEFPTYITQGSNNTTKLMVAMDGDNIRSYTTIARFKLPNGETASPLTFNMNQSYVEVYGEKYASGKSVYLTSAQTYLAGVVKCSIEIMQLGNVLYSVQVDLVINPTSYDPEDEETNITNAQYTNLVQSITELGNAIEGTNISYNASGKTLADLYDDVIEGEEGIKFFQISGTVYANGYYVGLVIDNNDDTFDFEFECFSAITGKNRARFVGKSVAGTTTINDLLNPSGSYNKQFALEENLSKEYTATGKTIAELYAAVGGIKILKYHLIGIDQEGFYIGVISPGSISGSYNFEFERYSGGERSSRDRWIGVNIDGSNLLNNIFAVYNDYYKPYMVGLEGVEYKQVAVEGKTIAQLLSEIGNHVCVLHATDYTHSSYIGYVNGNDTNGYNFEWELFGSISGKDRWTGSNVSGTTLVTNILVNTSSYYHPYALEEDVGDVDMSVIAPAYSSSTAYNKGSLCTKDGKLYQCNIAMLNPEEWNSSHWTERNGSTAFSIKINEIAGEYDSTQTYEKGRLCYYNNHLYRCTTTHSAEAWNSSHWEGIKLELAFMRDGGYQSIAGLKVFSDKIATTKIYKDYNSVPRGVLVPDGSGWAADKTIATKEDTQSYIAEQYDNTKSYGVGSLVFYQDVLYKCVLNTSAGDFDSERWETAVLGSDLFVNATGLVQTVGGYKTFEHLYAKKITPLIAEDGTPFKIEITPLHKYDFGTTAFTYEGASKTLGSSSVVWGNTYTTKINDGTNEATVADIKALITYAKSQGWIS